MKPRSLPPAVLVAALLSLTIAACGSNPTPNAKPETPTTAPTTATTSVPTPTPTTSATTPTATASAPTGPTVTIICSDLDSERSISFTIDRMHPDFSEAWSTPVPFDKKLGIATCEDADLDENYAGPKLTPVTAVEQVIWDRAKGTTDGPRDRTTLTYPYAACVEHDDPWYQKEYPKSGPQSADAATMLLLCPRHPNAAAIRNRIDVQNDFQQQIANGETINDGTWRVGTEVKPGTYRAETSGIFVCYWARKNASGQAIASGGAGQGPSRKIKVTIAPGDHSFYTENCGVWFRLN